MRYVSLPPKVEIYTYRYSQTSIRDEGPWDRDPQFVIAPFRSVFAAAKFLDSLELRRRRYSDDLWAEQWDFPI